MDNLIYKEKIMEISPQTENYMGLIEEFCKSKVFTEFMPNTPFIEKLMNVIVVAYAVNNEGCVVENIDLAVTVKYKDAVHPVKESISV